MAEIALIPVDAEAVEPESPSASSALPEEAVPAKRGRGRPPGAKNKARVETDPEPPPAITLPPVITLTPVPTPRKRKAPPPPEEDTEEEETPPPRKPRKRQKTEIMREPEPTSPRSQRVRCHVESQTRRRDAHAERVQSFSSMLDKMVAY
jgi:hypothetical protein